MNAWPVGRPTLFTSAEGHRAADIVKLEESNSG